MSKDFEYDPETGSFRFDESGGKTKKKNDVDVGGWIIIAALFAFGLWPIGLIALISKLSDKPKKVNSSRGGMRTSTRAMSGCCRSAAATRAVPSPTASTTSSDLVPCTARTT